jgi:membrane protein DedA with SNARE-associated domain
LRFDIAEQARDAQQSVFAEHFAVGVAGFDKRIGIAQQAIAGLELDIKLFVLRGIEKTQRNVAGGRALSGGLSSKKIPLMLSGAVQQRPRMTRVADRKSAAGLEERGDDGGGKRSAARQNGELLIEEADEFGLIQPVDEASHKSAQIGGGGCYGLSVSRDIGKQQSANASGGATGSIVNIASRVRPAEGLAVDPSVQAAEFDGARSELAAAPDFHALHVLQRLIGHCGRFGLLSILCAAALKRAHAGRLRYHRWLESAVLQWVSTYGYVAIFGLLTLGIIGLPIPDETLLTSCGFLIYRGQLHAGPTFASALVGSMCGITCSYVIGRTLGWKFLHSRVGKVLHIRDEQIRWVHDWFNRIGHWALMIGYFIPGVRHFTAIVAGTTKLEYPGFAAFAYSGALLWVSTFLFIGYHFGARWEQILGAVEHNLKLASAIAGVLIAAYIAYRFMRRRR